MVLFAGNVFEMPLRFDFTCGSRDAIFLGGPCVKPRNLNLRRLWAFAIVCDVQEQGKCTTMTRFHVLYCRRSDGTVNVLLKGKRQEPNQPTDEQLDQRPDKNGVSDYYREVDPDEAKHLDWRRKLGGMLARELDWKDKNGRPGTGTYLAITRA